jgi:hypothetical protein
MSFKFRQLINWNPGLFLNLYRRLPSILVRGSDRLSAIVADNSLPARTPSGSLSGWNISQVKLIWLGAIAILCGISGFWLMISSRPGNQVESDRAFLAETPPSSASTMTPEEGTRQSLAVLEVRRAELVISPQVRRAELVKPTTKKTYRKSKED